MTTQEIKKALREYAIEDTRIAIDEGSVAIAGTKVGVIWLNYEDHLFCPYDGMGNLLSPRKMICRDAIVWLMEQYVVEIAE